MNNNIQVKMFFRFLKENNAYNNFIENYNNNDIIFESYSEFRFNWIKMFNVKNTPIDCFDWEEATVNFDYWSTLNDKWIILLKHNKVDVLY